MKKIVKIVLNILICFTFIFLAFSILYFINGSLEMFPSAEQQEKARLVAGLFSILFITIELVLILIRTKMRYKEN